MSEKKVLVIVESPAKAKKIGSFLNSTGDAKYTVKSSVGHIRDIPIPSKMTKEEKEKYPKFGVNIDKGYEALYKVSYGKTKVIKELKDEYKKTDEIMLATDEDREGEAIAWHLLDEIAPKRGEKKPFKRMVFHEITKDAILNAVNTTRELNLNLIDAQESRRILDRFFGFEFSPVLWRRYGPSLSAGRVQTPTTKILVERELERFLFIKANYFRVNFTFLKDNISFEGELQSVDDKKIALGKDFNDKGELKEKSKELLVLDNETAKSIAENFKDNEFKITSITEKMSLRNSKAPFMTSTLQQAAGSILKFSVNRTMSAAQKLYEGGYITYMRTDSISMSNEALNGAYNYAKKTFGVENVLDAPKNYQSNKKTAQEAHEAIRPSGSVFRPPSEIWGAVDEDMGRLYELIFNRTIASQMKPAQIKSTSVNLLSENNDKKITLKANGSTIYFKGYLNIFDDMPKENTNENKSDESESKSENQSQILPKLSEGEKLVSNGSEFKESTTKPKARYTESSLVKKMEELGIGRPSTYASTIKTIIDRKYAFKKGQALVPTWLAIAIIEFFEKRLNRYTQYEFTSELEEKLDKVAIGEINKSDILGYYYFGDGGEFKGIDEEAKQLIKGNSKKPEGESDEFDNDIFKLKNGYQIHMYRAGAYLENDPPVLDELGNIKKGQVPIELTPEDITPEVAEKIIKDASTFTVLGKSSRGYDVIVKVGPYGPYFTEVLPSDVKTSGKGAVKAKMGSLTPEMDKDSVTIEDALKVLSLPRELGVFPDDNEVIKANNGRFGPYLMKNETKKDKDTDELVKTGKVDFRTIKKTDTESREERLFSITLDEAIEIYKSPKVYRRGKK